MSVKVPFTGGCVCGAVRYEVSAAPVMMFKCHCRDCQHVTGGAFLPGLLVPAAAFRLTKGVLKYHFTPSLAGDQHQRGFCADCGSRLTGGEVMFAPTSRSLVSRREVSMTQVGFSRSWISSFPMRNRGI